MYEDWQIAWPERFNYGELTAIEPNSGSATDVRY
jgi:hypothetical protein